MEINLYTKNNCSLCELVKRRLRKWNLKFKTLNVEEDADACGDYYFYYQPQNPKPSLPLIVVDGVAYQAYERDKAYKRLQAHRSGK